MKMKLPPEEWAKKHTEVKRTSQYLEVDKILKDAAAELELWRDSLARREITDKRWEDRCRISLLITRVNILRSTVCPHG